jgi:hypothetical protein
LVCFLCSVFVGAVGRHTHSCADTRSISSVPHANIDTHTHTASSTIAGAGFFAHATNR